jgi:EmrB/QacA subfamily drug resistance transporter
MNDDEMKQVKFWPVMIAIFFGAFISILSTTTVNIAIPVLTTHFDSDLSVIQWTLTGFMLAVGTISPITGYLGERFSYKRLYLFSLVGFTLFSALCALAWDATSLIAFRMLQGAFSGLIMPATMTIIYQVIPREKQAIAVSLWGVSAMLAPAIGPTFAGWLLQNWSWEWLFLMNIPVGFIAIFLVARMIPFYRMDIPKSFDFAGLLTVLISSGSLLVAISQGHSLGWTSLKTVSLFILGGVTLVLFIWRELTVATPLLNIRVFKNTRYTLTLLLTSIITISLYSGTFLTPVFLQNIQQVTPLDTGLILLIPSLAMAVCMPIIGKLYSRIGPRLLLSLGILLISLGTLTLSWLSIDVSHSYIILWMTVRNIGIGMAMMPASNAGMEQIPPQLAGHASSISNWIRNVMGSFAIAIFTTMLASRSASHAADLISGGATSKPLIQMLSFTMSVNDVYLVATFVAVAALPFSFFIGKNNKPDDASLLTKTAS